MQPIDSFAHDLVDRSYLASVESAIGAEAMADVVGSFLRDCETGQARLIALRGDVDVTALAREAHRLGGLLAQFGCPAAARAFKAASHAAAEDMDPLLDEGLSLIAPTCEAIMAVLPARRG